MLNFVKKITLAVAVICGAATVAGAASAQIIILDGSRVSKEAEANKDLLSKTATLRQEINQLSQYVQRDNGGYLVEAKAIEDKKALIGQKKYEEEMQKLQEKVNGAARLLVMKRNQFDNIVAEANRQIERASKPITKRLLEQHKAQVLMYKGDVIRHIAGIDVTTQFIEMLNDSLPVVKITAQPAAAKKPEADAKKPAADAKK